MKNKISVVDWLLHEFAVVNINLDNKTLAGNSINIIFETARKMHETQIKEAYNQGYRDAEIDCFHVSAHDISTYGNAKKYYNETFHN